MADEVNITPGQPVNDTVKSLADLASIQVNMVVKGFEAVIPVAASLTTTMNGLLAVSVNLLGSAAGAVAGAAASAGGTLLQLMGGMVVAPFRIVGNLAGAVVSTAQAGVGLVLNAVAAVLPPARTPV